MTRIMGYVDMRVVTKQRNEEGRTLHRYTHSMAATLLLASLSSATAFAAGVCVAHTPAPVAGSAGLPPSLSDSGLTLAFEETFDDQADFFSGSNDRCITGVESECVHTPEGWTHFYTTDKWHPLADNNSSFHSTLEISDANPRGLNGKSLVIYDESWGSRSQWGSDGILAKQFDSRYNEVYVEFYIQFDPGFRWESIENGSGTSLGKILRMSYFNGDDTDSRFQNFQGGSNGPIVFLDVKQWTISDTDIRSRLQTQIRCNPLDTNENYKCKDYSENSDVKLPGDPNFVQSFGDGGWHKVAMWAKLNTAPGVADGKLSVWYDDELVSSKDNVPYIGAGGASDIGWNMVMVGGNMSNIPEDESATFEQPWSIDDIRIYTKSF